MDDDVYDGYLIPKGSLILPNVWCVWVDSYDSACILADVSSRFLLHDPRVYHEPMEFKPERFLGPNPEPDPRNACFGFGRRLVDATPADIGKLIDMTLTRQSIGSALVSISSAVWLLCYTHKL